MKLCLFVCALALTGLSGCAPSTTDERNNLIPQDSTAEFFYNSGPSIMPQEKLYF